MQEPVAMKLEGAEVRKGYVLALIRQDKWDDINTVKPDQNNIGRMKWAHEVTGIKSYEGLTGVLFKYRKQLDIDNGGCVYYPSSKGNPYKFLKDEFLEFVNNHHEEFMKAKIQKG